MYAKNRNYDYNSMKRNNAVTKSINWSKQISWGRLYKKVIKVNYD